MTFDDYWIDNWQPTSMPGAFDLAMREIAQKAWNTATLVEREGCKSICEAYSDLPAGFSVVKIRERSNAQGNRTCAASCASSG